VSTIERMTRYGRTYQVLLDCGHIIIRTQDEVKQQQLYIGKRIGCEECAKAKGVQQ
jgi:hypothetical protein